MRLALSYLYSCSSALPTWVRTCTPLSPSEIRAIYLMYINCNRYYTITALPRVSEVRWKFHEWLLLRNHLALINSLSVEVKSQEWPRWPFSSHLSELICMLKKSPKSVKISPFPSERIHNSTDSWNFPMRLVLFDGNKFISSYPSGPARGLLGPGET